MSRCKILLTILTIILTTAIPATSFSTVWQITCEGQTAGGVELTATLTTKDLAIPPPPFHFTKDDIANYEIKDSLKNNFTPNNSELKILEIIQAGITQNDALDSSDIYVEYNLGDESHSTSGYIDLHQGIPDNWTNTLYDDGLQEEYEFSTWEFGFEGCQITQITAPSTCVLDSKFEETTLATSMGYYTDRSYTLTSVPSEYEGLDTILTPNDERNGTQATDYLTFSMPYDGTVYVAFDSRATSLPDWLSSFTDTGDRIYTSLRTQPFLKIFSHSYDAGTCINLGANKAEGFSGATVSNYIVFYGR